MLTIRTPFALTLIASLLLSGAVSAQQNAPTAPQGFLYGVGVGINQEIYQGYKRRVIPLPLIGYRGEKLSVYGPFVTYELAKWTDTVLGDIRINAKLAPRFAGFDDSDSDVFAGMAKRKNSLDAGVSIQFQRDQWTLEAETLADALNNSNGQESKLKLSYTLRSGPLQISPEAGISYATSNLVDYYYGVRQNEVTANRAFYEAGSAFNYHLGLAFSTPIFFGGMTRLGVEHHWYDKSISDSPLTDRDTGVSAFLAWSRFF
ncbi:MipA/OmpV family protein [Alishewanella tabrizica]|uniref:Structural protein MipA n=1 Tax=Alishewanella tabrizica TaxID=671278 RepID=A0ABQ2WS49_9ALTE|nr:MipA/OmpV family protein [Alishewanella tabrizica]GGW70903.1 structural protein MipA [Alishewanella tabrizica]